MLMIACVWPYAMLPKPLHLLASTHGCTEMCWFPDFGIHKTLVFWLEASNSTGEFITSSAISPLRLHLCRFTCVLGNGYSGVGQVPLRRISKGILHYNIPASPDQSLSKNFIAHTNRMQYWKFDKLRNLWHWPTWILHQSTNSTSNSTSNVIQICSSSIFVLAYCVLICRTSAQSMFLDSVHLWFQNVAELHQPGNGNFFEYWFQKLQSTRLHL